MSELKDWSITVGPVTVVPEADDDGAKVLLVIDDEIKAILSTEWARILHQALAGAANMADYAAQRQPGSTPSPPMPSWSELFPHGRTIFYEGDDPAGFAAQVKSEFGFDPSESEGWTAEYDWRFDCPAEHLDDIYGSDRFPTGS